MTTPPQPEQYPSHLGINAGGKRGDIGAEPCADAMPTEDIYLEPDQLRALVATLRAEVEQLRGERDEAVVRALQAWKDADAAIVKEVESRVSAIMGNPENEIARQTASKEVFRDERDRLQIENGNLRNQLAQARSRGDDKEISEKERDEARAELAALKAAPVEVTDEMVERAMAAREKFVWTKGLDSHEAMRAALTAALTAALATETKGKE